MLNENNQFAVLLLLNGAEFFGVDFLTFFTADQMEALVALFLGLRHTGILIAQIFWGLWLFGSTALKLGAARNLRKDQGI